ncbi:unnamed protein product [Ectocarpus sp. 12 AP-2014]
MRLSLFRPASPPEKVVVKDWRAPRAALDEPVELALPLFTAGSGAGAPSPTAGSGAMSSPARTPSSSGRS